MPDDALGKLKAGQLPDGFDKVVSSSVGLRAFCMDLAGEVVAMGREGRLFALKVCEGAVDIAKLAHDNTAPPPIRFLAQNVLVAKEGNGGSPPK